MKRWGGLGIEIGEIDILGGKGPVAGIGMLILWG